MRFAGIIRIDAQAFGFFGIEEMDGELSVLFRDVRGKA